MDPMDKIEPLTKKRSKSANPKMVEEKEAQERAELINILAGMIKKKDCDIAKLLSIGKDYDNIRKLKLDEEEKDRLEQFAENAEEDMSKWGDLDEIDDDIDKYIYQ